MKEDLVPFELAKKLKEKGFRGEVNAYYGKWENLFDVHPALDMNDCDYRASAPTISQVLKWLREEQAVHISISLYSKGWYCDVYTYEYYEEDREYSAKHIVQLDEFSTYEEAALAGIEYVIDTLI